MAEADKVELLAEFMSSRRCASGPLVPQLQKAAAKGDPLALRITRDVDLMKIAEKMLLATAADVHQARHGTRH